MLRLKLWWWLMLKWYEEHPAVKAGKKLLPYVVSRTLIHDPRKPFCDNPIPLALEQRASAKAQSLRVETFRPCRKCDKCLLYRRLMWRDRMEAENRAALRTWFVTLTFSEIHLAGIIAEAHVRFEHLGEEEAVEAAAYRHVQGYLKRLRKNGGRFRYCAVPEYGDETGRLHYHLLLHETSLGTLPYRLLDAKWRSFISAELVRTSRGSASYVSKYLTKSFSRIRASARYGQENRSSN